MATSPSVRSEELTACCLSIFSFLPKWPSHGFSDEATFFREVPSAFWIS